MPTHKTSAVSHRSVSSVRWSYGILSFGLALFWILVTPERCACDFRSNLLRARTASARQIAAPAEGTRVARFWPQQFGVSVIFHSSDSTMAVAFGHAGTVLFRTTEQDKRSPQDPFSPGIVTFCSSQDGKVFSVGSPAGSGYIRHRVHRSSGEVLFSITTEASIQVSPGGSFFCLQPNGVYQGPLRVLDTAGVDQLGNIPTHGRWTCDFLSDNTLLIAEPDTLTLISIPSGDRLWTIPSQLRGGGTLPMIRYSYSDSSIIVFDTKSITSVGRNGTAHWSHDFADDYVVDVAVDPYAGDLVVRLYDSSTRTGQYVTLGVLDPSIRHRSVPSALIGKSARRDFLAMWYRDGLVLEEFPATEAPTTSRSGAAGQTVVVDMRRGDLSVPEAVEGACTLSFDSSRTRILYLTPNGILTSFEAERIQ